MDSSNSKNNSILSFYFQIQLVVNSFYWKKKYFYLIWLNRTRIQTRGDTFPDPSSWDLSRVFLCHNLKRAIPRLVKTVDTVNTI